MRASGVGGFEFDELFALTARPLLSAALRRSLSLHFDLKPSHALLGGDPLTLQRGIYRALQAVMHVLTDGLVILSSEVQAAERAGEVSIKISAATSGTHVDGTELRSLLERLIIQPQKSPSANPNAIFARGVCPVSGAELKFRFLPNAGSLLEITLECPGIIARVAQPDAGGALAYVVEQDLLAAQALARRLERFGWGVTVFDSCRALLELAQDPALEKPDLVVAIESPEVTIDQAYAVSALWPDETRFVFGVDAGSKAPLHAEGGRWRIKVRPFLQSELWEFTNQVCPMSDSEARESRPLPLVMRARPCILVVDDDEVNRIIATSLLGVLDYGVVTAESGLEAIRCCERNAPDLVLMDIDMPGMNGYEAAQWLRRKQLLGDIPQFPIVSTTAETHIPVPFDSGIDAHIPKPLNLIDLGISLQKLLRGAAGGWDRTGVAA